MSTMLAWIRPAACILALALLIGLAGAAMAQQRNPDGSPDPDASAVNEQILLQHERRLHGTIDIPNQTASVLMQPAGRTWDYFHEVLLRWIGTIAIVGMVALLAIFYLAVGPLRVRAGRSGRKVTRFSAYERFCHWLTASSFVVLALTGLNITFGKVLLLPLIGAEAFSDVSQWAKYVHNYLSFAFVLGFALITSNWIRDNVPTWTDVVWFRHGGGFIPSKHAPAGRFNGGEKLVFWFVFGAGIAMAVSGYLLLFPFYVTNIAGMQLAQVVHSVIAAAFVAVIIAHIYIGTLGTKGAFEAMGTGSVDVNWAREHHGLWLEDEIAKGRIAAPPAAPAE